MLLFSVHPEPEGRKVDKMLTLKKVKEMVKAPVHTKRVPSPKVLLEDGRILLRKEFEHDSHLTLYHSGYVWFSTGKRNTVFHIHDCCGNYAYDAAEGKGDVIEEEYFENCEWHIRALFEGERRVEESQQKCEGVGQTKVCVSYHAVAEDWGEMVDSEINVLDRFIEKEALHAMMAVLTEKQRNLIRSDFRKWFPRMCQYGFIEGRDYEYMPRVRLQDEGGRTVQRYVKDYRITQDMAKKLCKLHHTAVSAAYRPQPFDWDVLLGLLHKKPPRRSSYEVQLSDSDSLVTTTQIAKEYGCGAKVFNRLLHLHGIQYRVNGQWVLYSEHHGKGYTSSLTFRLQRSDGSEVEKLHTAWTQKGRKFLYHTLKRRGVLPLAEQGG